MLRRKASQQEQASPCGVHQPSDPAPIAVSAPFASIISKRSRNRSFAILAAGLAAGLASGVNAQSLAQPRDTAIERRAAAYIQFREDVAAIEQAPFTSAEMTRDAHRRLNAHDSVSLSSAWVAFAALVAAETPEFAEALKEEVKEKKRRRRNKDELTGRDAFLAKLSQNPSYPRTMPGADEAMARVLAMTVQDGARITALGEGFKEQAYAIQKTAWGKAKLPASSAERLTDADNFARSRPRATTPILAGASVDGVTAPALANASETWSADWGRAGPSGSIAEGNAQVIMDRVLNLAARYAIGATNDKLVDVYAKNNRSDQCLSLAKLTLIQCIKATRTSYEEAFCLGEHGLNDVANCIGWVADAETGS